MKFVRTYPNKKAIITSLDKAVEALDNILYHEIPYVSDYI